MTVSPQSTAPAKPLAAYRLGLLSRTFAYWRDLFLTKPEFEWSTADSVLLAIEQLNEAVLVLADEINQNVYTELRKLLGDQEERWTAVCKMVFEYNSDAGEWNQVLVAKASEELTPSLQLLAESALAKPEVKAWCDLGVAVGEYHVQLTNLDAGQPLPKLDSIVSRAASATTFQSLPVLQDMVNLAPDLDKLSPREFLTKTVVPKDGAEQLGEPFDAYVMLGLLFNLDNAIQDALQGIAPQPPAATAVSVVEEGVAGPLVPKWEKDTGELRLGSTIARQVASQARNARAVLDAFEAQKWPARINNPVAAPIDHTRAEGPQRMANATRLNETIKTLNKDLEGIRFHADGTGTRITWERT